jgi:cell division protein FtsL
MSPIGATNAAYDLSLFEEVERQPKIEEVKLPKKQKVLNMSPLKMLALGAILVAMVGALLYSNVMLAEITANVNAATNTLEDLNNEYTRLEMELNRKMSISTIEEYATETLNMSKIEQYQVEMISINNNDEVIVTAAVEDEGAATLFSLLFQ